MTMSIRMMDPRTGQELHFSPVRDISYFWPTLLREVKNGLMEMTREPYISEYIAHHNVSDDELWKALLGYVKFCRNCVVPEITTPLAALEKGGFFEAHPAAQMAVFAKLGQVATRAFWTGIRSASAPNEAPPEVEDLLKDVSKFVKEISDNHASCCQGTPETCCSSDSCCNKASE